MSSRAKRRDLLFSSGGRTFRSDIDHPAVLKLQRRAGGPERTFPILQPEQSIEISRLHNFPVAEKRGGCPRFGVGTWVLGLPSLLREFSATCTPTVPPTSCSRVLLLLSSRSDVRTKCLRQLLFQLLPPQFHPRGQDCTPQTIDFLPLCFHQLLSCYFPNSFVFTTICVAPCYFSTLHKSATAEPSR